MPPARAMGLSRGRACTIGVVILWALLGAASGPKARAQLYGAYAPNPIWGWGGGYPSAVGAVYWPQVNFGTFYGWDTPNVGWWPPFTGWTPPYGGGLTNYGVAAALDSFAMTPSYDVASMTASTSAAASDMLQRDMKAIYYANHPELRANHGDRYNVHSTRAWSRGRAGGARLVDVTSRDGDVLWPLSAPTDGDLNDKRAAASEAIKNSIHEFRTGGGKVSVKTVSAALDRLNGYSEPAIEHLRKSNPAEVHTFIDFVRALDRGLRLLVGKELTDAAKAETPPAPKPAGP